MAYITNQQLIDRVGSAKAAQLTSDLGSTPDQDKLTEAVNAAQGEVDGYVGKVYATPVDLVAFPGAALTLQNVTLRIATYYLHILRPPVITDLIDDYKMAIAWLAAVAKGDVILPAAARPTASPSKLKGTWGSNAQNATRDSMGSL